MPAEQQAEVRADTYEVLLILAEALAQPLAEEEPEHAGPTWTRPCFSLDRAAALGLRTRAEHLRRADVLNRLDRKAEAGKERARADAFADPAGEKDSARVRAIDHFLQGQDLYQHGRLVAAIPELEMAARLQPKSFWPHYFVALCYLRTQKPAQAESHLDSCTVLKADFSWTYLYRGFMHAELGRQVLASDKARAETHFQRAAADFQRAAGLKLDETGRYALLVNRGYLHTQEGKLPAAIKDFQEAIALRPAEYHAFLNLAAAQLKQGALDRAAEALNTAARRQPNLPEVHRTRADIAIAAKQNDPALAALRVAVAVAEAGEPGEIDRRALGEDYLRIGLILQDQKQYQEATRAFEKCIQYRPTLALVHFLPGRGAGRPGQPGTGCRPENPLFPASAPVL